MIPIVSLTVNLLHIWEYRMVVFSSLLSMTSAQQLKAQLQANILIILLGVLLIILGI